MSSGRFRRPRLLHLFKITLSDLIECLAFIVSETLMIEIMQFVPVLALSYSFIDRVRIDADRLFRDQFFKDRINVP